MLVANAASISSGTRDDAGSVVMGCESSGETTCSITVPLFSRAEAGRGWWWCLEQQLIKVCLCEDLAPYSNVLC